jgi:hypothetical protein
MEVNSERTAFTIKGINARGEVRLGLIIVVIMLGVIIAGVGMFLLLNPRYSLYNVPFPLIFSLLFTGLGIGVFIGSKIGRRLSWLWDIRIEEGGVAITERKRKHFLAFSDFNGMYVGTPGMRFLSVKSGERIRIRAGVGGYAPYSSEDDIIVFDNLITALEKKLELNQVEIKKSRDNKRAKDTKNVFAIYFRKL